MFKIPLCCVHRSRYKVSYRPSRQSLAKAAGRGTEGEEIITLTFVRERDERGGVAEDTGLKLHTDAKGMYVHSVRPDSVGAPDCKKASASWRSGGFSQCQIMPEAAPSSGQPRSASQPLWPCCPAISGLLSTQARRPACLRLAAAQGDARLAARR